jgi:hypothetical protein
VVGQFQVVELDSLMILNPYIARVVVRNNYDFVNLFNELLGQFENVDLDSPQKWVTEV